MSWVLGEWSREKRSFIAEPLDRPIIRTLEYAREYLMKRVVIMKQVIEKSDGPLTPTATKLFNVVKVEASLKHGDTFTITTSISMKVGYILGRQQKKRKKSVCENILMVNNGKLSRRSKTVTCVLCKTNGHNKSSCKGPATNLGNKRTRSENVGELGRQLRKEKKNDDGEKTGNKGKQIAGGEKTVKKGKQTADVDKT
ncbi:hypothetical protein Tco_0824698 [Tanacetum coccineum]|uniref:Uncharacterized protein n=1 Tax=Tanacetum coccineum TaxID=301880 RepID=A0ABQ5ANA4_9ASTR